MRSQYLAGNIGNKACIRRILGAVTSGRQDRDSRGIGHAYLARVNFLTAESVFKGTHIGGGCYVTLLYGCEIGLGR